MPAQGKKSVATTESSEKNLKEALVPVLRTMTSAEIMTNG
jgi:hypothetical protein